MSRVILLVFGLLTILAGSLSAQTSPQIEDRRSQMERDLKQRQIMLSQQEAMVREAENNVMRARRVYDKIIEQLVYPAPVTAECCAAPSTQTQTPGQNVDPGTVAYKALDSATYRLNVLRADERNLRESVKVLREALAK